MKVSEIIDRARAMHPALSEAPARLVYAGLCSARGRLLAQKVNKKQKVGQASYQTLPCMALVPAPAHECACLPPMGCKTLRTKDRLPAPLSGMDRHVIQSVTSVDGEVTYSETSWAEKRYRRANKWTGDKPDYYLRQGHLYLTARGWPGAVSVTGLFGDPLEVPPAAEGNFPCGSEVVDCGSHLEREFPVDADLVDALLLQLTTYPIDN